MSNHSKTGKGSVNPGYARNQLAKALTAIGTGDAGARERVRKWQQVFAAILDGSLEYGSRAPIANVPVWATPEVVTGGFVTGNLLAAGPLQAHEQSRLGDDHSVTTPRTALNAGYLSEAGLAELAQMLQSGHYRINVPEEGALLVIAWLSANDGVDAARQLLTELAPYFDKLRFYPRPADTAQHEGSQVCRWNTRQVVDCLEGRQRNQQIEAQRESVLVWAPLMDRLVETLCQSREGGVLFARADDAWRATATGLINDIERAKAQHRLCKKPHKSKANFAQLSSLLGQYLAGTLADSGKARAAELLQRCIARRGEPGCSGLEQIRKAQQAQVTGAVFYDIARLLIRRLSVVASDDGIDNIAAIAGPVQAEEVSERTPLHSGVPDTLLRVLRRGERNAVGKLVESGVIPSADTLAEVLPQLTAEIRAMGIRDANLRRLYSAIYRAFRQRRSLLLLDLESQVRINELPWVRAIESLRQNDLSAEEISRQALGDISLLTIASFPQAIIPNKMLQEMRALAEGAKLAIPITDELAADIFMGTFTAKFLDAARRAAELLEGSLYAVYYGIDYQAIRQIPQSPALTRGGEAGGFAELVIQRAGVHSDGWNTAVNGMQIEQQQILTTHNLAPLTVALEIQDEIAAQAYDLSQRTFDWICHRLQANASTRHDHLIAIKNSAYAWRQMLFYLSLLKTRDVHQFLDWADTRVLSYSSAFQNRFAPALIGLKSAAAGVSPGKVPGEHGVQFLGWSRAGHWLMSAQV